MANTPANGTAAPRCAALIGPYLSGKTTLLEALLFAAGTTGRRGSVRDGNSVGDHAPEARARQMSTELNVATTSFLGDPWTILDCPGSVELLYEAQAALLASDVAIVVVEPEVERALTISALLRYLDQHQIPHMIFINKMDNANARVRDVLAALQSVSSRPLVLRQVPLRGAEAEITGYVDLVSERAYRYRPGQASDLIPLPEDFWDEERATRTGLLEKLADFDDSLLEQLLEEVEPPKEEIYRHLTQTLRGAQIVPVFLGSGLADYGVRRLWKALRHETPLPQQTASRLGIAADGEPLAQVIKTYHLPHTGKLSLARVWRGTITEGMVLNGTRVAGLLRVTGGQHEKLGSAHAGEVVGLTRMEDVATGVVLTPSGKADPLPRPERPQPVFGLAIASEKRADDVKLTGAIGKLVEEDPTFELDQNADTQEMVLWGQGDIHLQIAMDRLRNRHNLAVTGRPAAVPYKETIRHGTQQHSRFKRQSGGHGQFADVTIEVKALPRGSGFTFTDSVVGGAIPRNYIPAVEEGVVEALLRGPLGFPVVDVSVTLLTGQFHAVDSSDQAFKTAGRQGVHEALPKCEPMLLEPIDAVEVSVPNAFTARVQRLVSGRRGQILGYDAKPDWPGWDLVSAHMPQNELHDLIVELRSLTLGVGSFAHRFDHMQELTGRPAEKVLASRTADAAQ
ncbi:MAG TPA: elongation factor G [Stellaceae bacterium]|jgi:elongation factor G|nr:elongation factor G [Stellaceae bacterium]